MKIIEKRTLQKAREPVRRAWYEYAGAEVMAVDLGVIIGATCAHLLGDWQLVAVAGAIGIVLAMFGVFGVATWYATIVEKARAKRARETLTIVAKGSAPMSRDDVPPDHKRTQ